MEDWKLLESSNSSNSKPSNSNESLLEASNAYRNIYIQSTLSIITPLETKKNGVIIKNLYNVTIEKVFLIVLLITQAEHKSAYKEGVTK